MALLDSATARRNKRSAGYIVRQAAMHKAPAETCSDVGFPSWKSRFARSSGFEPERDGRYAPPIAAKEPTPRAPD